jgi:Predicted RNA-binding protein containing KH domain, possibly ribosomal protein
MLDNKQRSELKKIVNGNANSIVKFNIGKGEIDTKVLESLNNGIIKHEIIKISFLKSSLSNKPLEELILDLSSDLKADVVQQIGHTVVLYKANPKLKNSIKF